MQREADQRAATQGVVAGHASRWVASSARPPPRLVRRTDAQRRTPLLRARPSRAELPGTGIVWRVRVGISTLLLCGRAYISDWDTPRVQGRREVRKRRAARAVSTGGLSHRHRVSIRITALQFQCEIKYFTLYPPSTRRRARRAREAETREWSLWPDTS